MIIILYRTLSSLVTLNDLYRTFYLLFFCLNYYLRKYNSLHISMHISHTKLITTVEGHTMNFYRCIQTEGQFKVICVQVSF